MDYNQATAISYLKFVRSNAEHYNDVINSYTDEREEKLNSIVGQNASNVLKALVNCIYKDLDTFTKYSYKSPYGNINPEININMFDDTYFSLLGDIEKYITSDDYSVVMDKNGNVKVISAPSDTSGYICVVNMVDCSSVVQLMKVFTQKLKTDLHTYLTNKENTTDDSLNIYSPN